MITLLSGENTFEVSRHKDRLIEDFDGQPEIIDGSELLFEQLPGLFMGVTLFADRRLVIIKNLSDNKRLWEALVEWLPRISDGIHIVLIEDKPDKRTKTYKELQKNATLHEYKLWSERDVNVAEKWVSNEAKSLKMALSVNAVKLLVKRVGVDQWMLFQALLKLRAVGDVTPSAIMMHIDISVSQNVFMLFDMALSGDSRGVQTNLKDIRLQEDPFRLFGLLTAQVFQLVVADAAGEKSSNQAAKEFGMPPFVFTKAVSQAGKLSKKQRKALTTFFIETDEHLKTSSIDPWVLIEALLVKITQLRQA